REVARFGVREKEDRKDMKIAVMGATGTAGSRVVQRLKARDVDVVEESRSRGIDLVPGEGLTDALADVDAVVDASNVGPSDDPRKRRGAVTTATRNVVDACTKQQVSRLVLLSSTPHSTGSSTTSPSASRRRSSR